MVTPTDADEIQRRYYTITAGDYDTLHSANEREHTIALDWLSALIDRHQLASILDVGAGTGRAMRHLRTRHPEAEVIGVEPIDALREKALQKGIPSDTIFPGTALALNFPDDQFDLSCAFAVLHHIQDHRRAVREICRVSKKGVFLSDSNNLGQGSPPVRLMKNALHKLKLWKCFDTLRTLGKGYHQSDEDGVFYSYTLLDDIPTIKRKFPNVYLMSTRPASPNLALSASHLALFATV